MTKSHQWQDRFLAAFLLLVAIGIPVIAFQYESDYWKKKSDPGTRVIELTGHDKLGWLQGRFKAHEVIAIDHGQSKPGHPVIRVRKNEKIALKITSSDVNHGFTLKDYGIYISGGIYPGKVTLVEFVADMEGSFTFTCNAVCGKHHDQMTGTLIVESETVSQEAAEPMI